MGNKSKHSLQIDV